MLNIIQKRKYFYTFSLTMIILSVTSLSLWGLNLGIDFKGGTLMEVEFSQNVPSVNEVTESLVPLSLQSLTIQPTGEKSLFLRYLASDETLNESVLEKLKSFDESLKFRVLILSEDQLLSRLKNRPLLVLFFL